MRDLICALMLAIALASCCAPIGAEHVDRVRLGMSPAATARALPAAAVAFRQFLALFVGVQICASIILRCDLRNLEAKVKQAEWLTSMKGASLEVASR